MNFCLRNILIAFFLTIVTVAVYWQVRNFDFINYDDGAYIYNNPPAMKGLTPESIAWAFATAHSANWHPLTWLSHTTDVQFFGNDAGYHHLTNVMFHIANTLLLFFVLLRMTGEVWKSSFVAALFALHPLHVESVAWVSERKDVLSTFWAFLTLGSYAQYATHKTREWYLAALLFFILGLMSKPMLVTLPFVMLLLDFWPLRRIKYKTQHTTYKKNSQFSILNSQFSLLSEKIPFFILTILSSVVTFFAQKGAGAVGSLEIYSLNIRIGNALISYLKYIVKMFYPLGLAIFYPHPAVISVWKIAGAGILLASISLLAISLRKHYPYFLIGWLWYLGTLVPVIGLVQVGSQAMADRYSYIPMIGLFITIVWGVSDILPAWRYKKILLAFSAAVIIFILAIMTHRQTGYWQNSTMLFEHALDVDSDNYMAYHVLGDVLREQGKPEESIRYYQEALRLFPDFTYAHNNLGVALAAIGRVDEAIQHLSKALRINPQYVDAYYNMGLALANQGKLSEAIDYYSKSLDLEPDNVAIHNNMAITFVRMGKLYKAFVHFQKALQIEPDNATARENLKRLSEMRKKNFNHE